MYIGVPTIALRELTEVHEGLASFIYTIIVNKILTLPTKKYSYELNKIY